MFRGERSILGYLLKLISLCQEKKGEKETGRDENDAVEEARRPQALDYEARR